MGDATGGQKTLLKMTRYTYDEGGTIVLDNSVSFTVMLNPAEFKHTFGISYNKKKTLGQSASLPRFNAVDEERVNFSLVLDGTGVVPQATPGPRKDVKTQVRELNTVLYSYNGEKHEPNHVRLLWGSLIFFGRLENLSMQYTLFMPTGAPLRARAELNFTGAMSKAEASLQANRSSPDLSHRVVVREGDTLPLLCSRFYGDPGYYLEVARYNRLVEFRRLEPGTRLHFPPLS